MLSLEYKPYTLQFNFAAGTSRGVMHSRKVWFLKIMDGSRVDNYGLGEVAPLPGLSFEDIDSIEPILKNLSEKIKGVSRPFNEEEALDLAKSLVPKYNASILFGLEMALIDLVNGGNRLFFDTDFFHQKKSIKINGLIWMGDADEMMARIEEKTQDLFQCIKMKIGAIDFDKELELLQFLRSKSDSLIIRVDANGAFNVREALGKIKRLKDLNLHSIEQPILPSQMEAMQLLCSKAAVNVALDEELIGKNTHEEKQHLLDFLQPPYIVLKPSLLGGFRQTREWIQLAEERNIGWWITSALESNIGLNAICQFTSTYSNDIHQGLGTGQLYANNIMSPLHVGNGSISYLPYTNWGSPFS